MRRCTVESELTRMPVYLCVELPCRVAKSVASPPLTSVRIDIYASWLGSTDTIATVISCVHQGARYAV